MFGEKLIGVRFLLNHPPFIAENVLHTSNVCDYVAPVGDWLPAVDTFFRIFHNFLQ